MRGIVMVAARLALPGFVVAIFAAMSSPHAVAVRGAESAQDSFSFDLQHQLVDAEIGIGAFIRGEADDGYVTVAAAGRCGRCDAQSLQLSHGVHKFLVLRGGGRGQLPSQGASGGCSGKGAKVDVNLLHKGHRGALALNPGRS